MRSSHLLFEASSDLGGSVLWDRGECSQERTASLPDGSWRPHPGNFSRKVSFKPHLVRLMLCVSVSAEK